MSEKEIMTDSQEEAVASVQEEATAPEVVSEEVAVEEAASEEIVAEEATDEAQAPIIEEAEAQVQFARLGYSQASSIIGGSFIDIGESI